MVFSKHIVFRLTLVTLLLFAEHTAFAHEAEHVFDHDQIGESQEDHDKDFHSPLCAFHGAFDGLMSIVSATPPVLPVVNNAIEKPATKSVVLAPAKPVIPASRGPPFISLLS